MKTLKIIFVTVVCGLFHSCESDSSSGIPDAVNGQEKLFFLLERNGGEIAKVECNRDNIVVVETSPNDSNIVIKKTSFSLPGQVVRIACNDVVLWDDGVIRTQGDIELGVFQKTDDDDRQFLTALLEAGAACVENHSVILSEEEVVEKYRKLFEGEK